MIRIDTLYFDHQNEGKNMWKRNDADEGLNEPTSTTSASDSKQQAVPRKNPPSRTSSTGAATIGPSIRISGDISGDEDLFIRGTVEGSIQLAKNNVHIGKDGAVGANVNAQIITVEGTVQGDLKGVDQIIVKESGNVQGNISAPRVVLEDGCHFKGSIEMEVSGGQVSAASVTGIKPSGVATPAVDKAAPGKYGQPDKNK